MNSLRPEYLAGGVELQRRFAMERLVSTPR
jgi:hypothetical protein